MLKEWHNLSEQKRVVGRKKKKKKKKGARWGGGFKKTTKSLHGFGCIFTLSDMGIAMDVSSWNLSRMTMGSNQGEGTRLQPMYHNWAGNNLNKKEGVG